MKNLSIVIPCYNEGENILKLFELCRKAIKNRNDIEVVFVNNGSTDLTRKFIEQSVLKDKYSFAKLCNVENNIGYGNGILKGLELGCAGIITATCNVTAELSRKVYDDFYLGNEQFYNHKLCSVREAFDKYNLISGLHTYFSKEDEIYKNILPPLSLLNKTDEQNLLKTLKDLNFSNKSPLAA